jgi:twitching motility protein PilT
VSNDELASMLTSAMSGTQATDLAAGRDIDLSYAVKAYALRFRASIFRQATGLGAVFRHVRQTIPDIAALGLPPIIETFGDYPQGLVLIGGPTGSGKSTTLAALIDSINRRHNWHIVTIEDPVEVVHAQRESLVNQREVGTHARSFGTALRSTLRQDPDVILVGELRDLETIEFAVNAAETGHLVFGTVHTVSADSSIERLIHAFPGRQQYLIRSMLAESLEAVVCQQLLRRVDRPEARVVAAEVMINGDAIANLIRKEKTFQIASVIATHREEGMILMDQELERLVKQGVIDPDEALMKAVDKNAFATMLVSGGFIEDIEGRASLPPEARASIAPPAVRSSMPPAPAPAPAPGAGRTGGPPSGRPMSIPAGGGTSGTER